MGFQECEDPDRVLADAGLLGRYESIVADHAIAIAYRREAWTLLESGAEDIAEDKPGLWGRRAVQWARFEHISSGRHLLMANHHGPLPVGTGGLCGGKATAWGILRVLGEHAQASDEVLLTGDFNAESHTETVQELSRFLHKGFTGTSFGGVDHIFSSCGESRIKEVRNEGDGGSDHDLIDMTVDM